jgi:hypothetical protein
VNRINNYFVESATETKIHAAEVGDFCVIKDLFLKRLF